MDSNGSTQGLSVAVYGATDDAAMKIQAWWAAVVHHRTTSDSNFQVSMEIREGRSKVKG